MNLVHFFQQSSLSAYKEATGGSNGTNNPQIVIDPPLQVKFFSSLFRVIFWVLVTYPIVCVCIRRHLMHPVLKSKVRMKKMKQLKTTLVQSKARRLQVSVVGCFVRCSLFSATYNVFISVVLYVASTATPGSGSTIVNCPPGTSGIRQQVLV